MFLQEFTIDKVTEYISLCVQTDGTVAGALGVL